MLLLNIDSMNKIIMLHRYIKFIFVAVSVAFIYLFFELEIFFCKQVRSISGSYKYLENWVWWITMDVIAINIYYAKELYVTSGLYVIFLGLATYGLWTWYKSMRTKKIEA